VQKYLRYKLKYSGQSLIKYIKSNKAQALFLIAIFLVLIIAIWFKISLSPKDPSNKAAVEFEVKKGETAQELALNLQSKGLIKNDTIFILYAKIKGLDIKIKSGRYYLSPSMTVGEILNKLIDEKNSINDVRVTIPEGSTLKDIANILKDKGLINDTAEFISYAKAQNFKDKYDFLKDFPQDATLEGFLFPDTYFLPKDRSVEFYIDVFLKQFEKIYKTELSGILEEKYPKYSIYQIVTLASIVEKEAKLESERPIIAAVFYNRLEKGMPLQSCATIEFLLDEHKEKLSFDDLKINSPYNTYKNTGLPPGPIGAPGLSSLLATISPANVDYLYFVAKGDGSHIFTKTYADHLNAQEKIESSNN